MKRPVWPVAVFLTFSTVTLAQPQPPLLEFPLPTPKSFPGPITVGPDGALWFGEGYRIGRIAVNGTITEYSTPGTNPGILGIVTGPDGALWFTDQNNNWIGRLLPTGGVPGISLYPLPTANSGVYSVAKGSWSALVYGILCQQGRPNHHGRRDHRIPTAEERVTVWHNVRAGRCAVDSGIRH
ncbi:MAG: hypothetical protein ABSB35_09245 [Bryobacteraceae bacterium]